MATIKQQEIRQRWEWCKCKCERNNKRKRNDKCKDECNRNENSFNRSKNQGPILRLSHWEKWRSKPLIIYLGI